MGLITNDKKIITSGGDNTVKVWSSNIDLSWILGILNRKIIL